MSPADGSPGRTTVTFDKATVELDALQRAAYAVAAVMTTDVRVAEGDFVCTLFARRTGIPEEELRHVFRAEVNDQVLRARIAAQTEALRNLVFAVAFSGTGLVGTEPGGADGTGE
jgi:His-Xaa-Ser system protein HxsD